MTAEVRSIAAQRDRNQRFADDQLLDAVNEVRAGLSQPATQSGKQANRRR